MCRLLMAMLSWSARIHNSADNANQPTNHHRALGASRTAQQSLDDKDATATSRFACEMQKGRKLLAAHEWRRGSAPVAQQMSFNARSAGALDNSQSISPFWVGPIRTGQQIHQYLPGASPESSPNYQQNQIDYNNFGEQAQYFAYQKWKNSRKTQSLRLILIRKVDEDYTVHGGRHLRKCRFDVRRIGPDTNTVSVTARSIVDTIDRTLIRPSRMLSNFALSYSSLARINAKPHFSTVSPIAKRCYRYRLRYLRTQIVRAERIRSLVVCLSALFSAHSAVCLQRRFGFSQKKVAITGIALLLLLGNRGARVYPRLSALSAFIG